MLIVDDEPAIVAALSALLGDDYECIGVHSPSEALKAAENNGEFACVLADYQMPGMTGLELLQALRTNQVDVGAVLMTGLADPDMLMRAINDLQLDRFVLKPWKNDALKQAVAYAVDAHLRRRQRQRILNEAETNAGTDGQIRAALRRMADGLAHELNNPLHGVVSFASLLEKHGDDAERRKRYLQVIRDCALRCRDLVDALREIAHPQEDDTQEVSLANLVDRTLMMFWSQNQVQLEAEIDQALVVTTRLHKLQQVIVNLLQNAIDASPDGGRVLIEAHTEDKRHVLRVHDQGEGVPEELRERIFQPYFSTKATDVGTGLGLAISDSIMRELGGGIRIDESRLGGAAFEVWIPAH